MAEIKSTLEMVMARAEALCAEAAEPEDDTLQREGMKAAASFLSGEVVDIPGRIAQTEQPDRGRFCAGMLQVFLRHLALPRDAEQPWEGALSGLASLATAWRTEAAGQLGGYITEIRNILSRYHEHRTQLKAQLEQEFAQQAAMLEQNLAQQTGMQMKIPPDKHPKFQEEWQRVVDQMNHQYLRALDQYKEAIAQLFA